jgi:uncharacterized protein YcnI
MVPVGFLFLVRLVIFISVGNYQSDGGWRKELSEDDLHKTLENHESSRLGGKLESLWSEEENFSKNPSLAKALTKLFGLEYFLYGLTNFPIQLATT